jgi:hypothetical protein
VWWDTRVEETKEEYKGLSQVELAQVMEDEEVEVTESRSYPSEEDAKHRKEALEHLAQQLAQAQQQNPQAAQQIAAQMQQIEQAPPVVLYDITAKRSKKGGKLSMRTCRPRNS